jgi:hypothetical protein
MHATICPAPSVASLHRADACDWGPPCCEVEDQQIWKPSCTTTSGATMCGGVNQRDEVGSRSAKSRNDRSRCAIGRLISSVFLSFSRTIYAPRWAAVGFYARRWAPVGSSIHSISVNGMEGRKCISDPRCRSYLYLKINTPSDSY